MARTLEQLDSALAQLESWQQSAREVPALPQLTAAEIAATDPMLIRAHGGTQSSKLPVGELRDWILQQWGLPPKTISGDHNLDAQMDRSHLLLADATAGALTLSLPPLATVATGAVFLVQKIDTTEAPVTLAGHSGGSPETLNGQASLSLQRAQAYALLICAQDSWRVLLSGNEVSSFLAPATANSAFTAEAGKSYAITTADNSLSVTFPPATTAGAMIEVSKADAGTGHVSLVPASGDSLHMDPLGDRLHQQDSSGLYLSDGAGNWRRIGGKRQPIIVLLTTPGDGVWTPPPGVRHVQWSLAGGGGGGAAGNAGGGGLRGSAGAGGGYCEGFARVSSGQDYPYTIGAGGAGGVFPQSGAPGETSNFHTFGSATGGGGGAFSTNGYVSGANGGVGTGGHLQITGGGSHPIDGEYPRAGACAFSAVTPGVNVGVAAFSGQYGAGGMLGNHSGSASGGAGYQGALKLVYEG